MNKKTLPLVSVLIPTLNAGKVLGFCLESLRRQSYPQNRIEIIIADGGSTDDTLKIAKKYAAKVYKNPLKTGEAGKAVALRYANGELIALIDSDNILSEKDWLFKMVAPFENKEIFGSEPLEYTWRKEDGYITRYCSLIGMNDPLCHFLGNYDRFNLISNKWTDIPLKTKDEGGWILVELPKGILPTIGANGTILRKSILKEIRIGDYFIDIDIIYNLVQKGNDKFAKVKTGIVHLYCGNNLGTFVRKQKRRIKDFLYLKKEKIKTYPWGQTNKNGLIKFIVYCLTIIPLFVQALKGYSRKKDKAWLFHPLACWITLYVYSFGVMQSFFKNEALDRKNWSQ